MNGYGIGWRKWAALASLAVLAALGGLVWWLMGGCESEPPPANNESDLVQRSVTLLRTMSDSNILELMLQVAYFQAERGRLPAGIAEVEDAMRSTGWPATPTATTRGVPLAYRPTGARTYEIVLPGDDGRPGTADDVVIPETVPDDMPRGLDPAAFRLWWVTRQIGALRDRVPEGLRHYLPQASEEQAPQAP
ncbi:MAG: hypothetical protein WBD63_12590 [Phycisphaerae bacterium]|nr:hypothetical protein [Phycisphaerae bacterium]